jgi:hypothetical protein
MTRFEFRDAAHVEQAVALVLDQLVRFSGAHTSRHARVVATIERAINRGTSSSIAALHVASR